MGNATAKFFETVPGWAKGVMVVVGVAGVAIGSYLIYKKVKNMKAEKASKKEVGEIDDDMKTLQKSGQKQTLSASEVSGIANNLFTAFDGYGSNYDLILKNIVRINNQVDLLAVIKSYGVREVSSGKLNPEPNFKGTLGQTMVEELNSAQINAINGLLAKKGIKQRL